MFITGPFGIGAMLGFTIGMALGVVTTNNLVVGWGFGVMLGVALGRWMNRNKKL